MRDTFLIRKRFTSEDVRNKALVLQMLRYEDSLMLGDVGKAIYADKTFAHLTSLDTFYIFHRMTLAHFGFSTDDEDVAMYRTIFSNYYTNPHNYDADVMGAVCYMRENKCVYYSAPQIQIGDKAPDLDLLTLDGAPTSLHALLSKHTHKYVFVGAFSNS